MPEESLLVIARIEENADADVAVLVDVRMPNLADELHLGRFLRVVFGEFEARLEEAALAANSSVNAVVLIADRILET